MELIIMIGIVFLFGAVILSTVAQRGGAPPTPVIVVRTEAFERLPGSDTGLSLVILLLVIAGAVWLL